MKEPKEEKEYSWVNIRITSTLKYLMKYDSIYISSLLNKNLKMFFSIFSKYLKINILVNDNIDKITKMNKQSLLIYSEDIYGGLVSNKISINELYFVLLQLTCDELAARLSLKNSWAQLQEYDCNVINCVELFDQGYDSIYRVNETGELEGVICRHNFKENLMQSDFVIWNNIGIEYSDNQLEFQKRLLSGFIGANYQEVPVLYQNKVVASCQKRTDYFNEEISIDWSLIDKNLIVNLLGCKKILLSSLQGSLGEFYEEYQAFLRLEVLSSDTLDKYLSGYYDYVFCGSDVWSDLICKTVMIQQVYLDVLALCVKEKLNHKGIKYYYFKSESDESKILNYNNRHSFYQNQIRNSKYGLDFKKVDNYYVYPDTQLPGLNIKNGFRKAPFQDSDLSYQHTIYCYGPCTAMAYHVTDDETWVSDIQLKLNQEHMKYKIQFAGGIPGSSCFTDINTLNTILAGKYKKGDVVVQIGFRQFDSDLFLEESYYDLLNLYNAPQNRNKKLFLDWSGHLSTEGNQLLAEYVYSIIKDNLSSDK